MYDYITPPGFGDTFFQYVFDAQTAGLVNGQSYNQVGIPVQDGAFIARYWSGLPTIANNLQIYDWLRRQLFSQSIAVGAASTGGYGQMVIVPELGYPDSGNIRFDLDTVALTSQGIDTGTNVLASQLVFTGVRRRPNGYNDPAPSDYDYYEEEFMYPFLFTINSYATTGGVFLPPIQYIIPVQDYDFELRRIELAEVSGKSLKL